MKTLHDHIAEAEKNHVAIGHFNFSNIEGLRAIAEAARGLGLPVIVGVSEGERDFLGVREARALVDSIGESLQVSIFLNADHTYSIEKIKEVVEARYDSVIIDGAKLSFEDNVKLTREAVQYAKSVHPEILIEGELGYIGQSSQVLNALPEGAALSPDDLTTPEEAREFVQETGVDLFAPAVGNIHGMLRGGEPRLDAKRVGAIREAVGIPLVLHGGSGSLAEDFTDVISSGISIVHINTELRVAWRDAVKKSLQEYPDEVAPYKIAKPALVSMQSIVEEKLRLFNNLPSA